MQWIPKWLAKSYATVYTERRAEWFDFEQSKAILDIQDKRVLSLHLARLEERGFLMSKRDSVDRRRKHFRLIEPADVVFAYGLQTRARTSDVTERLAAVSPYREFVVGGPYATYIYTRYAAPGTMDIYVHKADRGMFFALLSDRSTSISVDEVLAEKPAKTTVHLHSTLTPEMLGESLLLEGIRYLRPELLVVEGLREQTEVALTDALAILITKRKDLDVSRLLRLAEAENLQRELGACLEILNAEAHRKLFNDSIIRKVRSRADLSRGKAFPAQATEETVVYRDISRRWSLRIGLSKALVSKIVLDLVR